VLSGGDSTRIKGEKGAGRRLGMVRGIERNMRRGKEKHDVLGEGSGGREAGEGVRGRGRRELTEGASRVKGRK